MRRHSFAIVPIGAWNSIELSTSTTGHASLAMAGIYLSASPDHGREAYMPSGLSDWLK
jgi:hypothetical protein